MSLTVLTPLGALLALAGVLPLAALWEGEGRARRVAAGLGLGAARPLRGAALAVAGVAAALGLAAAQPVLAFEDEVRVRSDAEVYVVLDTTISMLAAESRRAPTRFDRAQELAAGLRGQLPDVPVGLASFTDRVLPHLFPSPDAELYAATLERAVRVEHPPPEQQWEQRATTFGSLSQLVTRNFFSQSASARAFVLLTDGETRPYSVPALAGVLQRPPAVTPVVVHLHREGERLWLDGELDRGYESDPASAASVAELADGTAGAAFAEADAAGVAAALRAALGEGEHEGRGRQRRTIQLAPWLALLAVVPLAFLVGRANL